MIPETAPASPRVAAELLQRCTAIVCCGPDGCKHSESCLATEFDQRDATAIITLAQDAARREVAAVLDAKLAEFDGSFYDPADGSMGMLQWAVDQVRAMMVKP